MKLVVFLVDGDNVAFTTIHRSTH